MAKRNNTLKRPRAHSAAVRRRGVKDGAKVCTDQTIKARPALDSHTRAKARQEWEVEAQERGVEWLHTHHGSVGGHYDRTFDVPLASGGALALLMRADLSSQSTADRLFEFVSIVGDSRPSLDQLRMAQAIGRALDAAITSGSNVRHWELVRRAYKELASILARRREVVNVVASLIAYRDREAKLRAWHAERRRSRPFPAAPGCLDMELRAWKALELCARLDTRFAPVDRGKSPCVCELLSLLSGRRSVTAAHGIAAALSLACGAFGDERRSNETRATAFKRVRRLYEKATTSTRTL